jgi:hypothetical protein
MSEGYRQLATRYCCKLRDNLWVSRIRGRGMKGTRLKRDCCGRILKMF